MTETQDQAINSKESVTLWLDSAVVENLNELVKWRTTRKAIASKSSVIADLIAKAHKKGEQR